MKTINLYRQPIHILFDYEFNKFIKNKPTKSDYIFLLCSWFKSQYLLNIIRSYSEYNIIILANSLEEKKYFESKVKNDVLFCNHNAFLNEDIFNINETIMNKEYDLVIDSAFHSYKNVALARAIPNVIHIGYYKKDISDIILPTYGIVLNYLSGSYKRMDKIDINNYYNKSMVGGIFSTTEGACFASSQYLLSGLPVLSTKSVGGRDIWYNDKNSVICEDNEDDILKAYETIKEKLKNNEFNKYDIRNTHLNQMNEHKNRLCLYIKEKFLLQNETINIDELKPHLRNLY
jgi:hypothetical protein